ncbi:hypothetical protein NPIL_615101 [Nephila pilipes]|uniref:Uncharacterized protein n=1 Tax=Nephila pilipes TaxID=299642 RepID=A0A8X6Q6E3_NEPPI|nr:hypothetical protein NPIL_615101 [Nephila pilipes]
MQVFHTNRYSFFFFSEKSVAAAHIRISLHLCRRVRPTLRDCLSRGGRSRVSILSLIKFLLAHLSCALHDDDEFRLCRPHRCCRCGFSLGSGRLNLLVVKDSRG